MSHTDNQFTQRMRERIEWLKENNPMWLKDSEVAFRSGVYWVTKYTRKQKKAHEAEVAELKKQIDGLVSYKSELKEAVQKYINAPFYMRKEYLKIVKDLLEQ